MSQFVWPPASTSQNPANGTPGQTAPTTATEVAGVGPDGNLHPISTDNTGNQNVNVVNIPHVIVDSSALPAGASTSALQTTGNTSLGSIDTKTPALVSGRVPVDGSGVTQPVSGTVTVTQATGTNLHTVVDSSALPSGAATSALQTTGNTSLASIDSKAPALGQAVAASSVPVVLPASQITTLTPPTTVTVTQATGTNLHAVIDSGNVTALVSNFPATQTVAQATPGNLQATVTPAGGSSFTVSQATAANLNATVTGSLTSVTTVSTVSAVTAITNALPTGSNVIGFTKQGGRTQSFLPVYNAYTTTAVTTAAFTQLVASTTTAVTYLDIFDSSGQAMIIATGGAGSEAILAYVPPGGDQIVVTIAAGTRIAIKALTANASSGYILLNGWN